VLGRFFLPAEDQFGGRNAVAVRRPSGSGVSGAIQPSSDARSRSMVSASGSSALHRKSSLAQCRAPRPMTCLFRR
jgi:hypothetical protein